MRGRDHDDRRHKLLLTDEGVRVRPGDRTEPAGLLDYDHFPTGVPALDELLGGGLVRGGLTTLKHDGTTDYYTLVGRLLARAADAGMTLAVALPAEVSLDRLDGYWHDTDWDVDRLFAADRLIVLELAGKNGRDHRNVLSYDADADRDWERLMERTYERAGSDPLFALVDTEPLLQTVSDERAREVRYRAATARTDDDDVVVYTVNPRIQPGPFVGFLVDTGYQTLDFYRDEDGLEWLSVEKTPTGSPGASRLVAYESDPPYVDFV
jgi:KaiC/GvpD/RAD55 family RecA-like ATPase